jgi:hypothetical protein
MQLCYDRVHPANEHNKDDVSLLKTPTGPLLLRLAYGDVLPPVW